MDDVKSLTHTKWNCKYHIVFAPKYRRKVFYEEKRLEIGAILRELCRWKGVEIIEGEVCPDHVHMLISIPPKMSVSGFMGFLKGKSSLMIYQRWGNMKFKYRNRQFWCRGYYVDTVTYLYGQLFQHNNGGCSNVLDVTVLIIMQKGKWYSQNCGCTASIIHIFCIRFVKSCALFRADRRARGFPHVRQIAEPNRSWRWGSILPKHARRRPAE